MAKFISTKLEPFKSPHLLWERPVDSSQFLGMSAREVRCLMLESCGYIGGVSQGVIRSGIDDQVTCDPRLIFADRYGGSAIGRNGGSARGGYINNLHIKGVGLTPLASAHWMDRQQSGRVSLREAIREVAYARYVNAIDGVSAIEPLAIAVDIADLERAFEIRDEIGNTRVLLIRPDIKRLAHFERAIAHWPQHLTCIREDAMRVHEYWSELIECHGADGLEEFLAGTFLAWSRNIAKFYVESMDLGQICTSNIDLQGRFFDFGSATSVPGWGCLHSSFMKGGILAKKQALVTQLDGLSRHYAENAKDWRRVEFWRQSVAQAIPAEFERGLASQLVRSLASMGAAGSPIKDIAGDAEFIRLAVDFLNSTQSIECDLLMDSNTLAWNRKFSDLMLHGESLSAKRLTSYFEFHLGSEDLEEFVRRADDLHIERSLLHRPVLMKWIDSQLAAADCGTVLDLEGLIFSRLPGQGSLLAL